jgi:F-type H+-transporting ATPase subunit gamma
VIDVIFIGKKASEYFVKRGVNVVETILKLDRDVSYNLAKGVAEKILRLYQNNTYQEVKFIYNEFKSAISQKVVCEQILPVFDKNEITQNEVDEVVKDYIFEPHIDQIIDELLNKHFIVQTYRCMCESVAAEHGARMTAMENATNNSKEVISKLTLTYNKLRQEKITTELTEIVSGAEAL